MTVLQRIDPHGCGCDAPEQLARLIGIDEALDRIARNAAPVSGTEALPLMRAPGRVLAEPVRAAAMTPPFDNAAMDGYAVDTADFVGGGPWRFAVAARIPAGASCTGPVGQARVARIFTGAPLPAGADAVIRQEDACRANAEVTFENRPARWSNSCRSAMPEETQMHLAYTMAPGRGDADLILAGLASDLTARGLGLCGTVQINTERPGAGPCDMDVRVLPDGPVLRISQDLGPSARGCRLDPTALETAVGLVSARLHSGADLLIVNKFGKHEAEGRGFRDVIAQAMVLDIPVLVGLNSLNRPAFEAFAGDLATQLPPDRNALARWAMAVVRAAAEAI